MISEDNQATPAQAADEPLANKTVVLDCRWLGMGGAGRVTELLLREFQDAPPPGDWILWGRRDRIEPLQFAGAAVSATDIDPRALMGQRLIAAVPTGDVVVYLHQVRPMKRGLSVTVIHDTIPIRYGGGPVTRAVKRLFFIMVARSSNHVLTDSELSKEAIHRDLSVPMENITVMRFPVDLDRAARIWTLRQTTQQRKVLLYLGRFDRHKNLHRLCSAFQRSRFAASGGRLTLIGGWDGEAPALKRWITETGIEAVHAGGQCTEHELDALLASSAALIMPSLEEGYGLPAFEAAATGLPVAVSRTGAMVELPDDVAVQFDAHDEDAILHAIDEVTERTFGRPSSLHEPHLGQAVLSAVVSVLKTTEKSSPRRRP